MTTSLLTTLFKKHALPCLLINKVPGQHQIVTASDRFYELFQLTPEVVESANALEILQLLIPQQTEYTAAFDLLESTSHSSDKQNAVCEIANTSAASGQITFRLSAEFIADKSDQYLLLSFLDISQQVAAQKQILEKNLLIEEQERNLKLFETATNTGYWELNLDNGELFWSHQLFIISGLEPFSVKPTLELALKQTHPDNHAAALKDFNNAIQNGTSYQSRMTIVRDSGEERSIISHGTALRDDKGTIRKVFGLLQDITDSVTLSNKLQETVKNLEGKNQLIQSVIENVPIGIAVNRLDNFESEFFNSRFSEIYGWNNEIFHDLDLFLKCVYPDEEYRQQMTSIFEEGIASGDVQKMKWQNLNITTQSGEKRIVNTAYIPITEHGYTISTVVDVTQLAQKSKELEDAIIRYQYVTKATSDAIWDWDIKEGKIYWGEGYETLFGYKTFGNEKDTDLFNNNVHPEDREATIDGLRQILAGNEKYWQHEYRYKKANGDYAYVVDKGFIVRDENGVATRVVGSMQDVTSLKKEQEHLKLLESVIRNTNDAIIVSEAEPISEPGPRILFVNESFYKLTGYTPEEVQGKTPRILQGPLTDPNTTKEIHNALEKWEHYEGTILNYKKNGEIFWNNLSINPIANENGWYTHWISIQRDVTEKVQAENKILMLNRLYAFTARLNHFILEAKDEKAIFKEACNAALEAGHFLMAMIGMFENDKKINLVEHAGLKDEDSINAVNLFEQADNPVFRLREDGVWKVFNNVPELPAEVSCKLFTAGYPVGSCIKLPILRGGKVAGVFNLYAGEKDFFQEEEIAILTRASSDISTTLEVIEKERQRTAAEQKLKEKSEQLNKAQRIAHIGNWNFDFATLLINWSNEACKIYGLPDGENTLTLDEFKAFLDEESIDDFLSKTKAGFKTSGDFTVSHKIYRRDGSVRYVVSYASLVFDENKIAYSMYGLCHDVTEYKQAELALLKSKNELADIVAFNDRLINASPMGISSFDAITGQCKLVNKAYLNAIGASAESALSQNFRSIPSWHNTTLLQDAEDTLRNGTVHANEIHITTSFNKKTWLDYTFLRFYDNDSPHLLMLVQDISEGKDAEIRLAETQEKYRQIVETTQEGIYLLNDQNCFTYVNKNFAALLEYTEQELTGKKLEDIIDSEDQADLLSAFQRITHGYASKLDHHYISKSGKKVHVSVAATPLKNDTDIYTGLLAIVTDLTEKEKLEALFEKASRLARIGSWEVDLTNDTVFFSDITREIHEVDEHYIPTLEAGLGFYKKGKDRDAITNIVKQALITGFAWDEELVIVTARGNEKWIRSIGEVEMLQGKPVKLFGSFQDIDLRKKAEQELIKVLEEKNNILESIDDAFFAVDENWTVTYWNQQAEKLFHKSKDTVIGEYLWKHFKEAVDGPFYKKYHLALETKLVVDFEEFGIITGKWLGVTVYPNDKGLSVYLKDINQRKKVEKQLSSEKNLLRTLIDNLPDTIYYKDEQGRKLISNKVDYTLLGAKSETEVLGKTDLEIFPSDTGSHGYYHDMQILQTGQPLYEYEEKLLTKDGREIWLSTSKLAVRNEHHEIIGLLGIGRDITLKKQSIIELNKLNEQLEQNVKRLQYTNQELEQFAYVASHDLQEPLRMITSFLTQIEKKYNDLLDDKGRQYIYFAVDGARRMRQIILDLLEYSRTGRMDTHKEPVNLNNIVQETLQLHNKTIISEKATIITEHLPVIYAAATPMRQVFQNLIGNSLKYRRKDLHPEVRIGCSETPDEWQFTVEDNGIGISPEYYNKIFVIFQRLHSKEAYSGTGIGLAITKKIIENMGGQIWVESSPGNGSCFYFTIPKKTNNENH